MTAVPLRLVPIDRDGSPLGPCPPLTGTAKEVCATTASFYERVGFVPPWIGYLAVSGEQVVGTCAFTRPPVGDEAEIAYFTFPEFEKRGIATSMARSLMAVARDTRPGITITAQTKPEPNASTRILAKLGFVNRGTVVHPEDGEVWEWVLAPGTSPVWR